MHYSVAEVAFLLRLCEKTVLRKLHDREFGEGVINVGGFERPDYRIPASGVNAYVDKHKIFAELGIAARSAEDLRQRTKAA